MTKWSSRPATDEEIAALKSGSPMPEHSEGQEQQSNVPKIDRDDRIAEGKRLTKEVLRAGGDDKGIAFSKGRVKQVLDINEASSKRDEWSDLNQQKIAYGEHHAANKVSEMPTRKPDSKNKPTKAEQHSLNNAIARKAEEGAQLAKADMEDTQSNGSWLSRFFFGEAESEPEPEPEPTEPEQQQLNFWDMLIGKDLYGDR